MRKIYVAPEAHLEMFVPTEGLASWTKEDNLESKWWTEKYFWGTMNAKESATTGHWLYDALKNEFVQDVNK